MSNVSRLGLGFMRWPSQPDEHQSFRIIDYVYQNGVNYYEACSFYNGGNNELIVSALLSPYPRDSYFLCDKLPIHGYITEGRNPQQIFEEQLLRCNTEYFDYYLIQCVDRNIYDIIREKKIVEYLCQEKEKGRIHKLGFSFHDNEEWLIKYLDLYDWDCIQLQLNYLDWFMNNHQLLNDIIQSRNIPSIVMGPLKGGNLSYYMPKNAIRTLNDAYPDRSIASIGMQFVNNIPGVQTILTGATTLEELQDNVETILHNKYKAEIGINVIRQVVDIYSKENYIPCTYCRYCENKCPIKRPISKVFHLYNSLINEYNEKEKNEYLKLQSDLQTGFNSCLHCDQCSKTCPQKINVQNRIFEIGMMYR